MRLLGKTVHCLRHAIKEEGLGLLLAAVAVRRGNQFLGLGTAQSGEEIGKDWLQRTAQPDVEEVRQVGVADVVVVGRIGGNKFVVARCFVPASSCLTHCHVWLLDGQLPRTPCDDPSSYAK